jgi:hypothetical protein
MSLLRHSDKWRNVGALYYSSNTTGWNAVEKTKIIHKFKNWKCVRLLESYGVSILGCRRTDNLVWMHVSEHKIQDDSLMRHAAIESWGSPQEAIWICDPIARRCNPQRSISKSIVVAVFSLETFGLSTLRRWAWPVGLYLFWWLKQWFAHCRF